MSKETSKTHEVQKTKPLLRCSFTDIELLQLGKDLAQASANAAEIEDELKTVTAQIKARLQEQEALASSYTSKIQSGFEYRAVECEVRLGFPKKTQKTTTRLDTHQVVAVREMSPDELQRKMEFDKDHPDVR